MEITFETITAFLRGLFGVYNPITYVDSNGINVIPAGLSGVNFEYVLSVGLFCLVVFEVFRLLGVFLSRH